jgi:Cu(I)/Ag(I) efflux system membrane protein CusA/SilA
VIERFVEGCLSRRGLVLLVVLVLVILGALSLRETSVDAIPDIGENLVLVYTNWPGRSPRDVEDQVTYPLTVNLMGVPKVKTVRSTSMFGFSLVNVIFEDNVGPHAGAREARMGLEGPPPRGSADAGTGRDPCGADLLVHGRG